MYERRWRLKVKIRICFMQNNSWTVALRQMKFSTVENHRHAYNFYIWIHVLFDKAVKYGDGAKFRGYVAKNAEPLCVKFCFSCNVCLCKLFKSLLSNVREVGWLVRFRPSCFIETKAFNLHKYIARVILLQCNEVDEIYDVCNLSLSLGMEEQATTK
jgi:hypothetical protein